MNSNYMITVNEAIVRILAKDQGGAFPLSQAPEESIGLAAIDLAESTWLGRKYRCEEFLQQENAHYNTLGIIGMNPIGQALAQEARLKYEMEILYYDRQPVPEIEAAFGTRFLIAEEIFQQADVICVALPLSDMLARLIRRHYMTMKSKQTVCIAWGRSLPIERAAIHLGRYYSNCVHLNDLAAIAGLSKFRLARLFSATFGISPHRFQLLLRVFYARSMLHRGVDIGDMAYQLGFSDQSHFGRCFRSITNMTPGQYQKTVFHSNAVYNKLALETSVENT